MQVEVTKELLEAINRAADRMPQAIYNLETEAAYHAATSVGDIVREATERLRQDYDLLTGWLKRVEERQ